MENIQKMRPLKIKAEKDEYRKYFIMFLVVTFGLCWGFSIIYAVFNDQIVPVLGELTLTNPIVLIALNLPSVLGIFIYYLYGRTKGLKQYLRTLVPRKKDLIWFPIIIAVMVLYVISVRLVCMLIGIDVPEMTYGPLKMMTIFLKNFYEEIGMLGVAFGYYGFVLPYLQRVMKSNIKAGLLTGFILGMFLAPGYIFSSFETATSFPLYLLQMMLLSVCVTYVLNEVRGNVLFFIMMFWIAATGSKVQLYYFIPNVQMVQIALFAVLFVVIHFLFKAKNAGGLKQSELCVFPDFIEA